MLTRATLGTMGVGTLVAMQASGLIGIHGNGPADVDRRKQLMEAGWKPFSIQIGPHYFSYTYSPIGLYLSIVGNITDTYRYKQMEQKDALTRTMYGVSLLGATVFNQSFLSGLSNVFRALSGQAGEAVGAMRQALSQSVGSMTTPRIVLDMQRLVWDPTRYSSDYDHGRHLKEHAVRGAG